ncbi:MAG TPA: tetratricopeptide repeat protein [Casimicrobiaceae bacterium]|nr:tetratricopeptide repeat protein [Casimicrobiaceae bacterium]
MSEVRSLEWLKRGREHQWASRPVDAMLCFQRAISLDPRSVDPRFLLGEVHWQLGAIPAALAAWRESARIAPSHVASQLALAEALLAFGDATGAAAAAKTARTLAPDDLAARVLHATAALDGGDREALIGLSGAVRDDVSRFASPVVGGTLARVLNASSDVPGAVELAVTLSRHADRVAFVLLAPLVGLAVAHDAPPSLTDARPALLETLLQRSLEDREVDTLRVAAMALHRAARATDATKLAERYARACTAFVPSGAPLRWPTRTHGAELRIALLLPAEQGKAREAFALMQRAADDLPVSWLLLVADDVTAQAFTGHRVRIVGAAPDEKAAAAVAADDPDMLVDLAGLARDSGRLLALSPAASVIAVAFDGPAHVSPLVTDVLPPQASVIAQSLRRAGDDVRCRVSSNATATALNETFATAVEAHRTRNLDAARTGYEIVLADQALHAPTLHFLAVMLAEAGDQETARRHLEAAIEASPSFVDARVSAARLSRRRGDIEGGLALIDAGLAQRSGSEPLWRARGELELARNDGAAAEAAFVNALRLKPTDAVAHYNLGVALQKQGRSNDAARAYQRALAFDADLVDAHFNLAVLFQEAGHVDAAVSAFRAVLDRDPRHVASYKSLGEALLAAARIDEWLANFRRFEEHCPDALPLAVQALEACQYAADSAALERYLEGLRRERFKARDATELIDSLEQLLYLLLFFDVEPEIVHRFAHTYASTAPQVYGRPMVAAAERRPGRLRVGYLSGDFRNHVMGKMMEAALRHHDRSRFALYLYSTSSVIDAWTDRFVALAERFDVIAGDEDRHAAQRIVADDLDVLVDLSGHTKGGRPGILALKPARVQITHVASAGSVGLEAVDFKLTDDYADVPGNQEGLVETLLPMAGCVYPYRTIEPPTANPFTRTALGLRNDAIVIGVFVAPMKLSRRCLSLWREVLGKLPSALLAFSPTTVKLRPVFERLCEAANIPRDRLVFLPQGRDDSENQGRYAVVDFVLDPMPFGGVNGVLEPLGAGVPVVTLVGQRHGERSAYSILANLGVTQTVAESGRDYVEIAVHLGSDAEFARSVREAIRAGLRASTLVDMPGHTRNLEAAYIEALSRKAPDALAAADG